VPENAASQSEARVSKQPLTRDPAGCTMVMTGCLSWLPTSRQVTGWGAVPLEEKLARGLKGQGAPGAGEG
jgi:hypothetical protein